MSISPYRHQIEVIQSASDKHLLAHSTGTGKTMTSLWLAERHPTKTLIITKKGLVKIPWQRDCFLPDAIIISKENFKKTWADLPNCQTVIVDEVHAFCKSTSGFYKSLSKYLTKHNVQYRYFLTATPYCSSPWDIYNLAKLLGHHWDYIKFRSTFFNRKEIHWRKCPAKYHCFGCPLCVRVAWEPKLNAKNLLASTLRNIGSVIKLEDCVDVPEQIFRKEELEPTKEQVRTIKELVCGNHAVMTMLKHRIECGHLSGEGYEADRFFDCPVTERVLELAAEFPKMAVVCRYRTQMEDLARRLDSRKVLQLHGDVKDASAIVREAESLSDCILLIQAACSEGYEIPSFPVMCFASQDYSYVNLTQMFGRILRINKLKKNLYIFLVTKGVSEEVYECLNEKKDYDPAKSKL